MGTSDLSESIKLYCLNFHKRLRISLTVITVSIFMLKLLPASVTVAKLAGELHTSTMI